MYSLYSMAKDYVKERLVLYYVIREGGLVPDESTLASEIEAVKQEYLDEYINQYLEKEKKTREDYSDSEWESFKKARANEIFSYYDDSHFEERAYYAIVSEALPDWVNVKTLDDEAETK